MGNLYSIKRTKPNYTVIIAVAAASIIMSSCSVMLNPASNSEQVTLKVEQPINIPTK